MAKVKVLPHPKVILVKQFIKDFNRDIASVQAQIEILNETLLYSAKVKNNALAAEAWPTARRASKVHKDTSAQLERLICVKQTLETVRDQYGVKCRQLRSLQTYLQNAKDQLARAESGAYDGIHVRAQAIEASKSRIRGSERELNAFKI